MKTDAVLILTVPFAYAKITMHQEDDEIPEYHANTQPVVTDNKHR